MSIGVKNKQNSNSTVSNSSRASLKEISSKVNEPERVRRLSVREFIHEFRNQRKPVIITDATEDWPALKWTPESLSNQCAKRDVVVRNETGERSVPFPELVDQILASTEEQPAPYARNINIESDLPELWDDIQPQLQYTRNDWKSSRLLPKDFIMPNGLQEFFMGGVGAKYPRLHIDYWGMDGFVSQIYNTKEFILVDPIYTDCLYAEEDCGLTSVVEDIRHPDLEKYPKVKDANIMRFLLNPGDTLYMPNRWWHTTFMPETSITVITATWHAKNWPQFCQQYRERANVSKLKKAAMLAYLKAFGIVKRIQDSTKSV